MYKRLHSQLKDHCLRFRSRRLIGVSVADSTPYSSRRARAAFIERRLAELYPNPAIPLDHTNAFTLLVAVLLSAQCTDKRVNLTTPRLFSLADTPVKMTRLSVDEIDAI